MPEEIRGNDLVQYGIFCAYDGIASAERSVIRASHRETDISDGLPMFQMVGYLSDVVFGAGKVCYNENIQGSSPLFHNYPKQLVQYGINGIARKKNHGKSGHLRACRQKITVNRDRSRFDLPLAISVLAALGLVVKGRH